MITALSPAEVLEEVVVAPRWAFAPVPDLQLVQRPGWMQLITPSFKSGGFNEVALAVLGEAEADAVIDATLADYRARGLAFRWTVGPDSRPLDLAERLTRRGLSHHWVRGMAKELVPGAIPSLPPEVEVVEVDARSVGTFNRVMAEGWEMDVAPLVALHELILRAPDRRQRLFLASHRGVPAGVATYVAFPRSAYLLGAVVLPAHRGAGLYRALVHARLADAAARGLRLATSQARDTSSAPILERLGFDTVCRFPLFHG